MREKRVNFSILMIYTNLYSNIVTGGTMLS